MEFRVLGALDVRDEGRTLELRGSKRRTVLALLVLHANEVIRSDRLIDELWGEHPPANASAALHNHVSRLRKEIGSDVIVTKPWGYVLRTDPEAVDLRRFEGLLAEAKPLPARERTAKLAEALALWRGPALADLREEPALRVESARLDELRLAVLEQRIDADLELGRHEELVPELEAHVGEHPLRERLRGQLILALYRSGHQAEALETYRETRRLLVEELGIEPSQDLRELERAILCQDPALGSIRRPIEPYADEPPDTRWRWPRSPLLLGAALALLVGSGAAVGFVVTSGSSRSLTGPQLAKAALPTFQPSAVSISRPATTTTTVDKPPAKHASPSPQPHRSPHRRTTSRPPDRTPSVNSNSRPSSPRSLPPVKKKLHKRNWVYWLADDFTDPVFNADMWHQETFGTGLNAVEQNGRLEDSITSDAVVDDHHGFEKRYVTNCELGGDFDAFVEFELITWPSVNGLRMTLGAGFPVANKWLAVERAGGWHADPTEVYGSDVVPDAWARTDDARGALRLRRKEGVLSAYYRSRAGWVRFGSQAAFGPASLVITFNTAGETTLWGGLASTGAFDNFHATADSVACHGAPLPPRKRRKRSNAYMPIEWQRMPHLQASLPPLSAAVIASPHQEMAIQNASNERACLSAPRTSEVEGLKTWTLYAQSER
jgi:DNA-binding SARP family transcriptional activator